MAKFLYIFLTAVFIANTSYAQIRLSGKVTDKKSEAYQKLLFYQEVFKGAGELTLLARELSVNQGLSTEFGAIVAKRINFEQGIERIINAKIREDQIFGGNPTVRKY